jgi:hypothetical protein
MEKKVYICGKKSSHMKQEIEKLIRQVYYLHILVLIIAIISLVETFAIIIISH